MTIRFHFQETNPADEKNLKNYIDEKKLGRLTRLLLHGNLELGELTLHAKHFLHRNLFLIKLELSLGKKELVAEENSHKLLEAFDLAFDRLINQARKMESLRHDK